MDDQIDVNEQFYALVDQNDCANELASRLASVSCPDDILLYLHHHDDQHLTLLMLAALHGKDEMVRVMLAHSSNMKKLVELRGNARRVNRTFVQNTTALWCACDRSHYIVARTLIDVGGAKIDHGPRYSVLIDAVVVGRLDIVRFFIENGYVSIDSIVNSGNFKLNSLIMAVIYGHTPIVAFLLEKGAKFEYNTSAHSTTPLGFAAIKGHLDIVRLLCSVGACTSAKNKQGQTPLMLAAQHNRQPVVDYLFDQLDAETGIQQLELVACSFLVLETSGMQIQDAQVRQTVSLMRKIFDFRAVKNISKRVAQPIAAYGFHQECQTMAQFNQIEDDHERLYIEVLLMRERLLVPERDEALFKPLLVRGDALVRRGQYEYCLDLWEHTFYLYQNLELETGLHRFVWLFCKMLIAQVPISAHRFVQICRLTLEPSQQKRKDDCIKNAVCLLAIAMKVLEQPSFTRADRHLIAQWIGDFCRQKRVTADGESVLQLTVDVETFNDINYRTTDTKRILNFPNLTLTQFLLTHCSQWIDVNAIDDIAGNTPLHVSCRANATDSFAVVQLLINAGAHIDHVDDQNQTALDIAVNNDIRAYLRSKQFPSRLKCLCAHLIIASQLPYELLWREETEMNTFLRFHSSRTKTSNESGSE